jgi:uncharacterized protein YbjQ (UPF0145 family)
MSDNTDVLVVTTNDVPGLRFDTSEMGETWTEICAYGTAVRISPLQ